MIKRFLAIITAMCLLLSGCMLKKQDYSGLIAENASIQALVPVDLNSGKDLYETDNKKDGSKYGSSEDSLSETNPPKANSIDSTSHSQDSLTDDPENSNSDNSPVKSDTPLTSDGNSSGTIAENTRNTAPDENNTPDTGSAEKDLHNTVSWETNTQNTVSEDNNREEGKKEGTTENSNNENKRENIRENSRENSNKEDNKSENSKSEDSNSNEIKSEDSKSEDSKSEDSKSEDSKSEDKKPSSDNDRYKVDTSKDKAIDLSSIDLRLDEIDRLAPSTTMAFEELVGDNGIYGYPEGFQKPGTYRIVVDLYHQLVMAFTRDENGEYTVPVRYMLCSSGANSTQSPTGIFKMRNYRVRYALFNNTTSYAQYWSLITGRIYFHSILYTAKDASTYTESYKRLGTNVSHGCIRLTVPDARWIWYNCAPETVVEIRKGSKNDKKLGKLREKMILAAYPSERLKLKKSKIPMTDNWTIEDIPHEVGFENGSQ